MKKSLKTFASKTIKNTKAIKGGGFGSGTKKNARRVSASRAELQ